MDKKKFDFKNVYQEYLKEYNLDENKFQPIQKLQTKHAFLSGGHAMMKLLIVEAMDFDVKEQVELIDKMQHQIIDLLDAIYDDVTNIHSSQNK